MYATTAQNKSITLRHLVLDQRRMIGIQFYPDKVIQALVKQLPSPRWSAANQMVVIPNSKENLASIFRQFRGVAWIDTRYFFINKPVNEGNAPLSVNDFRKRPPKDRWRYCPEEFYQKLELRRYSLNTARSYIGQFERFINSFPREKELMSITEAEILKYMSNLVKEGFSESYSKIALSAIKFYFEVVKEMPNRFYNISLPKRSASLPKVLAKEDISENDSSNQKSQT